VRGTVCPTDYDAAVPLDKRCFADNPVIRKVLAEESVFPRGNQWVRGKICNTSQFFFSKPDVNSPPPLAGALSRLDLSSLRYPPTAQFALQKVPGSTTHLHPSSIWTPSNKQPLTVLQCGSKLVPRDRLSLTSLRELAILFHTIYPGLSQSNLRAAVQRRSLQETELSYSKARSKIVSPIAVSLREAQIQQRKSVANFTRSKR